MGGALSSAQATNNKPNNNTRKKIEGPSIMRNNLALGGAIISKAKGWRMKLSEGALDNSETALALPRGGILVRYDGGSVQFGIPPETIKDSLMLGLGVPTTYVVLGDEMFDRDLGINVAEIEFPAYFNFFVNRKKVTIVTTKSVEKRIRTILQETLLGPAEGSYDISQDFAADLPGGILCKSNQLTCWPDFVKEGLALDENREFLKIDNLIEFQLLDVEDDNGKEMGKVVLNAAKKIHLKYNSVTEKFIVRENNKSLAQIDHKFLRPRMFMKLKFDPIVFQVPEFGVTMLGSSHGFDPSGTTTGFIVWVNYRGIMVDPPAQSPEILEGMGIHSRLIDGLILTHCHADHDAGAFQKILTEEPITVYTTKTIMDSFIRKYSAVSGLEQEFLRQLFRFDPVKIGEVKSIHNGCWEFFYSLHVIPTIGFEVKYDGEGIIYSGDTRTENKLFERMLKDRQIGKARYEHLTKGSPFNRGGISGPSNSFLEKLSITGNQDTNKNVDANNLYRPFIFHEAGVPPIHTPLENLAKLSEELRERLFVVHTNEEQVEQAYGGILKVASEWSTINIKVQRQESMNVDHDKLQLKNLLSVTPIFEQLMSCASPSSIDNMLQLGKQRCYPKGSVIAQAGELWDRCVVIRAGVAEEKSGSYEQMEKEYEHLYHHRRYHVGNVIGEVSLVSLISKMHEEESKTDNDHDPVTAKKFGISFRKLSSSSPSRSRSGIDSEQLQTVRHSIVALRDLHVVEFAPDAILPFFNDNKYGVQVLSEVVTRAKCKILESWDILISNRMISNYLTQVQTQSLQIILSDPQQYDKNSEIVQMGEPQEYAWIVISGTVRICSDKICQDAFQLEDGFTYAKKGALICDINSILHKRPSRIGIKSHDVGVELYPIVAEKFCEYLDQYPGIKVLWLDRYVIC